MNIIERNYSIKIDNFIKEMDKITDNEYFFQNKDYLIANLIDVVHAIADNYVRNKTQMPEIDKDFVLAFCYLNNQLKHDKALDIFSTPIYSAVLPTRLPFRLGDDTCSIQWADFKDNGNPKAEGKRVHYDTHLNGKDVRDSLIRVKQILDNVTK